MAALHESVSAALERVWSMEDASKAWLSFLAKTSLSDRVIFVVGAWLGLVELAGRPSLPAVGGVSRGPVK